MIDAEEVFFVARVQRPQGVGTWHFVAVPAGVRGFLGDRGRVPVKGMLNGKPFVGLLLPQGGGRHIIVSNRALRDELGLMLGGVTESTIHRDWGLRKAKVPALLEEALDGNASARGLRVSFELQQEGVR